MLVKRWRIRKVTRRDGRAEYQVDFWCPHLDGLLGGRWGFWGVVGYGGGYPPSVWKTVEEAREYIQRQIGKGVAGNQVVEEITA